MTGDIETVNGTQIGDTDLNIQTSLPAGRTYVLEVTSGAAAGLVQEFVTVNGGTITLPAAVAGLAADDKYQIRVAPTLEEIFGTTLQSQSAAGGSDVVWLPNGPGAFDKYYYQKSPFGGASAWKKINPNNTESAAPNTPVIYLDGFFVEVKSTQKNLVISGELRADVTSLFLGTGFNAVGTVFPVGSNLVNSGISTSLQSQSAAGGSDVVWVANGPGVFDKYYYQKSPFGGASVWRKLNPNGSETTVDGTTVNLSTGLFIERKGAATTVKVNPPAYGL